MKIFQSHINLFRSFFRGREDVYAVRWEKGDRSGYMPAYHVDWNDYNQHKAAGGVSYPFLGQSLIRLLN